MHELKILIKKDLLFNLIFVVSAFLYNCSFFFVIPEKSNLQEITFIFPSLMLFTGIIVRMSYVEDNYSTATFLKVLPISKELIVKEKYLLSQILIVIGLLQGFFLYRFYPQMPLPLSFSGFLMVIAFIELHVANYLYAFFRFNFVIAYNTAPLLTIGILFILYLNGLFFHSIQIHPVFAFLIFLLSLIINYLSMKASIKYFRK